MRITGEQKIKIGLFTLIGIAILFIAVFLIGSRKNMFTSTYTVYGVFKNVGGLQIGNNVRLAGINIGVVTDIEILTDSTARVDITLDKKAQKFIKTDAKLTVGNEGLIGDKLINITPGTTNKPIAQEGQRLATIPPFDTDKMIARATRIVENAADLTGDLSEIVAKINNGQGSLGRLLNSDIMARNMESTVKEAKHTIGSVKTATGTLNEDLKAAQSNFLLRGFFKKKEQAKQAKKDSINKAKGVQDTTRKKRKGFLGLGGKE